MPSLHIMGSWHVGLDCGLVFHRLAAPSSLRPLTNEIKFVKHDYMKCVRIYPMLFIARLQTSEGEAITESSTNWLVTSGFVVFRCCGLEPILSGTLAGGANSNSSPMSTTGLRISREFRKWGILTPIQVSASHCKSPTHFQTALQGIGHTEL